jgi:diguanylate cyclase (GGDEF)-like protein
LGLIGNKDFIMAGRSKEGAMALYTWMDRLFPRRFTHKIFLMAFLGIHVPLISFTGYVLLSTDSWSVFLNDLLLLLGATLLGTGLTLWGMHQLLAPLFQIKHAMAVYESTGQIEALPNQFRDELGEVMQQVNRLVFHVSEHVADQQRKAHTDALTGLLNRRGLLDTLPTPLNGHLLFIDLNRFKHLNDTYGHDAGDQVLLQVGKRLQHQMRQSNRVLDLMCRWGGDEFVIYLHQTDTDSIEHLYARILRIFDHEVSYHGCGLPISASIGVAEVAAGDCFAEQVALADRDMLQQKASHPARIIAA